jgi:hypothetical protein
VSHFQFESIRGWWLLASLLAHLPPDFDYSRFHDHSAAPDRQILGSLVALGAQGIDESLIDELDQEKDEAAMLANIQEMKKEMKKRKGPVE